MTIRIKTGDAADKLSFVCVLWSVSKTLLCLRTEFKTHMRFDFVHLSFETHCSSYSHFWDINMAYMTGRGFSVSGNGGVEVYELELTGVPNCTSRSQQLHVIAKARFSTITLTHMLCNYCAVWNCFLCSCLPLKSFGTCRSNVAKWLQFVHACVCVNCFVGSTRHSRLDTVPHTRSDYSWAHTCRSELSLSRWHDVQPSHLRVELGQSWLGCELRSFCNKEGRKSWHRKRW